MNFKFVFQLLWLMPIHWEIETNPSPNRQRMRPNHLAFCMFFLNSLRFCTCQGVTDVSKVFKLEIKKCKIEVTELYSANY